MFETSCVWSTFSQLRAPCNVCCRGQVGGTLSQCNVTAVKMGWDGEWCEPQYPRSEHPGPQVGVGISKPQRGDHGQRDHGSLAIYKSMDPLATGTWLVGRGARGERGEPGDDGPVGCCGARGEGRGAKIWLASVPNFKWCNIALYEVDVVIVVRVFFVEIWLFAKKHSYIYIHIIITIVVFNTQIKLASPANTTNRASQSPSTIHKS